MNLLWLDDGRNPKQQLKLRHGRRKTPLWWKSHSLRSPQMRYPRMPSQMTGLTPILTPPPNCHQGPGLLTRATTHQEAVQDLLLHLHPGLRSDRQMQRKLIYHCLLQPTAKTGALPYMQTLISVAITTTTQMQMTTASSYLLLWTLAQQ